MREVLIHARLATIRCHNDFSENVKENLNTTSETRERLSAACRQLEESNQIQDLVKKVFDKDSTDIGHFWISFLEMTDPLAQNIHACHMQNAKEYLSSTFDMLPGHIAYDNQDYSKWSTDFWAMMMSLPKVQLDFFSTHFSQSISGLPYSCMPMDMWIEVTMNLYSKLKGGWF